MKSMYICLPLVFLCLFACDEKQNQATEESKKIIEGSIAEVVSGATKSSSELGKISCNGVGDEHSGQYHFSWHVGEGSCPKKDSIELANISKVGFSCIQKDSTFSCILQGNRKIAANPNIRLQGCIDQDGLFQVEHSSDLGFLSRMHYDTIGATDQKRRTIIAGDVFNDEEGVSITADLASNANDEKGCVLSWELEVDKIADADQ